MKRISKFTFAALASLLTLVATLGFTCTKAQKQAVVDLSLTHLVSLIGNERGALGDVTAAVAAFRADGSESSYQKGVAAFEAVIARHDLSPRQLAIARTAADIFRAFAPATFAEMDPNSEDARAARRELEDKFRRLEKLTGAGREVGTEQEGKER